MGIQIYCSLMLSFLKNKFGGSKQKGLKQNNQYVTIRKSKYLLARNQDNVSEWRDMSICGLMFQ
jgi:hypothetical protein